MHLTRPLLILIATQAVWIHGSAVAHPEETPIEESLRFAPIDLLAGACWMGTFPNGARDVHCYEWSLQNGFIRDHHQVRGGESGGVYSGDTYFGWDASNGRLAYWYFNSLGGVSEGYVEQSGGDWFFREAYEGATHEEGTVAGETARRTTDSHSPALRRIRCLLRRDRVSARRGLASGGRPDLRQARPNPGGPRWPLRRGLRSRVQPQPRGRLRLVPSRSVDGRGRPRSLPMPAPIGSMSVGTRC